MVISALESLDESESTLNDSAAEESLVGRALRGAKFLTPPRNYPLSQTQIHPYPGILRENYPFPPVPVKKKLLISPIYLNIINLQNNNALSIAIMH